MGQHLSYHLRVIGACMKKDLKSALGERLFTILSVLVPVNFLILMSLFVLAGSNAPTAVVMQDRGTYAQQLYTAMSHAHSFRLQQADAQQAQQMLVDGQIVAIVTIPPDFDARVQQQQAVQVDVQINNLNTDFTDDIRRAVPLSITTFYAKAFPNIVTITAHEHDMYAQDTDYIPYLMVSILALGLIIGGILQAGIAVAREWEKETIKELLLSPASRSAVIIGKMLASLLLGLISVAAILVVMVLIVGIYPVHWDEVLGFTLLCLIPFIAAGIVLGALLKHRLPVMALSIGISIPLFFVSGAFGPISFSTQAIQVLARIFPLYYAIVLEQHAFHNFVLSPYGPAFNALVLLGYAIVLILLAVLVLRRSTVAH
ncbi:ABC transporter permease [Ktedonosporobacter rubrisoli]|uniref:ABC transporter permease n=1 Tax=Ktedonosporobacter rubrisoli TaxID=2509675 RepID=A0A4P6K0R0_KTERU|nr:ABC transporter permease [Ktedonosporobacter rubrisoli]QBD81727.1 ABC transporter permease [Ktedonosporobacter rubrisoli]